MSAGDPWRHEHVEANGVRFHYVTAGKGPLVLLLHGFPQFWYTWRHQIPALAERFRVVAPDLRGYNGSGKPRRVRDFRGDVLGQDVRELVRALGETEASVVGHDWGGAVAWIAAANHPDVVRRLVVLNCPHPRQMARHLLGGNLRQLRKSWYMFLFQLPWLPERGLLRDSVRIVGPMLRGLAVRKDAFSDADLDAYRSAMQVPGAMTAAVNYYRAAFRYPFSGARHRVRAPTLVIWGTRDRHLGEELLAGQERWVKGSYRVERIFDAAHWVPEEAPARVNELLLEFLGSTGP